jgi:N-carbamoylputrescine amidase
VRVAAVQVRSRNGEPDDNLRHAEGFVRDAVQRGAELVLCPEFLATGYLFEESIWDVAERAGGRTESWLARLADELNVVIGATYLEGEGDEFFNTFSLFGPGRCIGRVRKRSLPFFEGWFFTPCSMPKLLDTHLGRIAVGICNDNQTAEFQRDVVEGQPDLILMPHSAPTPKVPIVDPLFRPLYERALAEIAERYATTFGIPVVMANKATTETTVSSLPLLPAMKIAWRFRGHSAIVDGDGAVLAQLVDSEGVLVQDVTLDPSRRRRVAPATGYWSFAPPFARTMSALLRALARRGQRDYLDNPQRLEAARRLWRS